MAMTPGQPALRRFDGHLYHAPAVAVWDSLSGHGIRFFEQYVKQLGDPKGQGRILGSGTVVRKLIVAGLRHGGVWAAKIVGKVSKKAGDFLARNGAKVADAIEDIESWSETRTGRGHGARRRARRRRRRPRGCPVWGVSYPVRARLCNRAMPSMAW
ncbi:hypothetical protein [Streptomyces sp. NPDC007100]|uniref:hypothetical protein n=1 Tax=Streptomyces sp. NPDC007100 TaxID=3155602 RepID=UPI00340459A3